MTSAIGGVIETGYHIGKPFLLGFQCAFYFLLLTASLTTLTFFPQVELRRLSHISPVYTIFDGLFGFFNGAGLENLP